MPEILQNVNFYLLFFSLFFDGLESTGWHGSCSLQDPCQPPRGGGGGSYPPVFLKLFCLTFVRYRRGEAILNLSNPKFLNIIILKITNQHIISIYYISSFLYQLQHNPYPPPPFSYKQNIKRPYSPIKKTKKIRTHTFYKQKK